MSLWIVTIGSSDVQLDSDRANQEKGRNERQRSDKVWSYWYTDELKAQCHDIAFEPKPVFKDKDETYRIAPRILGRVYQTSPEQVQQEIWSYLTFPLLDNFTQLLTSNSTNYPLPEAIAILLTDQSAFFADYSQQRRPQSPYWQDTCELKAILQRYFSSRFPDIPYEYYEWVMLNPTSEQQRLDDWDQVLQLVQAKFSEYFPKELPKDKIVYVSHQAGTPAISSAVQFSSLAQFGDRVRFLVSSERDKRPSELLESSSYLKGIRIQEAKKLLERHDYSGVKDLIYSYLSDETYAEIKILLDAAIQWNFANFNIFVADLQKLSDTELANKAEERSLQWWWTAYEEVYLAMVRRDQGNTVEAFFHSFRAFEGIFSAWSNNEFGVDNGHIDEKGKKGKKSYLKQSVLSDAKDYFSEAKFKQNGDPKNDLAKLKCKIENEGKVLLDLSTIHKLFRACRSEYQSECQEIEIFWDERNDKENNVSEKRNIIFHQVQGMSESDLWDYWAISSPEESPQAQGKLWEKKLLNFLNFIVRQDCSEGFESLEEASLMAKVHQELERAIAHL